VKIATYNINSIRRRLPLLIAWLAEHKPDILCLQETKVQDHDFPLAALRGVGYHAAVRGMKSYNGVAILTREEPEQAIHGLGAAGPDEDCRIIQTVVGGVRVINTYAPQGYLITSEKYAYKLQWFARMRRYFEEHLDPKEPVIWLGDLNVAPEPIDVYHPDRRVNDVDFHIDARNAYKETIAWGFEDVFRKLHPERVQYTFWDFFRNAFARNYGWRIDHILATAALAKRCTKAEVDLEPRKAEGASDHTIVWAEFKR
jgi:exodeoxyribonuclease-3